MNASAPLAPSTPLGASSEARSSPGMEKDGAGCAATMDAGNVTSLVLEGGKQGFILGVRTSEYGAPVSSGS